MKMCIVNECLVSIRKFQIPNAWQHKTRVQLITFIERECYEMCSECYRISDSILSSSFQVFCFQALNIKMRIVTARKNG